MSESLQFLFVPIDAVGHITACIGMGQELMARGHSVAFAISNGWRGKLTPLGFSEEYVQDDSKADLSVEAWNEMIQTMAPALALPSLEKLEHFHIGIYTQLVGNSKEAEPKLREIVARIKPDLIIVDCVYNPALSIVGIPWMVFASISPVGISTENVPPAFSGYPAIGGNRALWDKYKEKAREVYGPLFEGFKNWILEKGGPELKYDDRALWTPDSPYGNIYMYPQEMNYDMHRPDPPNWHQFDALLRYETELFEIPAKLQNLPGKLVYVSLGSIGCSELNLMRKLIAICKKSPHRFIFSKGRLGDELELADNMWGANNVPQTNVLPMVDLVITHGGNNTITESFYFGTKILVLPIFVDQLDNASRVEETGLGLQFDPYRVTEQELLDGIETLLGDDLLEKRMKTISTRIKASNCVFRAAELLENVAKINSGEYLTTG